jgi:hypothetical protein
MASGEGGDARTGGAGELGRIPSVPVAGHAVHRPSASGAQRHARGLSDAPAHPQEKKGKSPQTGGLLLPLLFLVGNYSVVNWGGNLSF